MGLMDRFFGPLSRDEFARRFAEEMHRVGFVGELTYDAGEFCLRSEQPRSTTSLTNFYAEHCKLPRAERKDHLRKVAFAMVASRQEMPDEFEHARYDLRLKLWCRAALEKTDLRARLESGQGLDTPVYDVGEHLVASVVFDLPTSVRTVGREDFEKWDVTFYEAIEVARQNLAEDDFVFASVGERLYAAATGDSYDASRLLLTDVVRRMEVRGDHVAMVPNRDCLLITGSEDDEGLRMMLELAEKASDDPRPMLFTPLRLDGDEWFDWMPPDGHPLRERFGVLEIKFLAPEYHDQKELLDALHEQTGTDVFVANYTAVQRGEEGQILSYAMWARGVDTLLPRAQYVMFYDPPTEKVIASGPWEDVWPIVGELMERQEELYPPRWRVREFPTAEQLRAIGRAI
jgi:hypothetical protein